MTRALLFLLLLMVLIYVVMDELKGGKRYISRLSAQIVGDAKLSMPKLW